jgi:hypothetical protein
MRTRFDLAHFECGEAGESESEMNSLSFRNSCSDRHELRGSDSIREHCRDPRNQNQSREDERLEPFAVLV